MLGLYKKTTYAKSFHSGLRHNESVMEVSSESPRVPLGIGWGICQFSVPKG